MQTYKFRNGLFGSDDGGYDNFIAFLANKQLVVSGTISNYKTISKYLPKANAGELNKWICLSVHWDVPAGYNKSFVYCNGKKLTSFSAHANSGSDKMTFGDLNPNSIAPLHDNIAFFSLYKEKHMLENDVKLHHKVLCNWYAIDHDTIQF